MMKRKKTLAGGIFSIIVILIIAGMVMVFVGLFMLYSYQKQMSALQYKIAEEYMLKINQGFSILNMDIRDMLYNGEEIRKVTEAFEPVKQDIDPEGACSRIVEQNNRVRELKNTFLNMGRIYGTYYNFFFYDVDHDVMTEYGNSSYTDRKSFTEKVVCQHQEDTLRYTRDSRWFMMDGNLCTIYKTAEGIIGVWTVAEDFVKTIFELGPEQCSGIELYFPDSKDVLRFEKDDRGIVTCMQVSKSDEIYYTMRNADFQCRFILDTSGYRNMIVYPMFFLILIIIYLVFVTNILLYTRRNILSQVNFFYSNLLQFKDTARFNENTKLIEFAEAGKVLNELSEEINKLRIDIYEEQLARQRTELDYVQLQIRPHFYLNCLNIIYSMAQVNRTKEIQEIAFHVSKYLRYIFKKSMDPIPVERELEFTENYLKVLECMYAEDYPCHIQVQDSLRKVGIPPLLIQTFVENSLKHNMGMGRHFHMDIRIDEQWQAQEQVCRVQIADNGTGFQEEIMEEMNQGIFHEGNSEYHIGLRNAVARMELLYGSRFGIHFANGTQGGAEVTITIPVTQENGG